jgi:DNA-binding NarL/FixJ family response regulator
LAITKAARLAGKKILIVEDSLLLADQLGRLLEAEGCSIIGPAATVDQALRLAELASLDGAILDINLQGAPSFVVGTALARRGKPFMIVTGYGEQFQLPHELRAAPRLQKPVEPRTITEQAVRTFGT